MGAALDEREYRGQYQQRRHRGRDEAANHGATQRGGLLAAFAQAQGHGRHAGNHGQAGHKDWAQAAAAAFHRSFRGRR